MKLLHVFSLFQARTSLVKFTLCCHIQFTNCKLAKIQFPVRAISFIFQNLYHYDNYQHAHVHMLIRIAPGGGTQVQRGVAPALRISRKKGSFFKTSACPRFCKRRVLFCTQVRSMGVKIPFQSTKYTRL